jgi:hypothetical protein
VLQFGRTPTKIEDLSGTMRVDRYVHPRYQAGVFENYGLIMSSRRLQLNGGLNYQERGVGDFEDLEMFGGNIDVHGTIRIGGTLCGNIRDVTVREGAALYANRTDLRRIRDLDIEQGGQLHTVAPLLLEVTGRYSHSGRISSGESIDLRTTAGLTDNQSGVFAALNEISVDVPRVDRPRQSLNSPALLRDPAISRHLRYVAPKVSKGTKTANANLEEDEELERLKKAYYERMRYDGDQPQIALPAFGYIARNRKRITYIDHYLNTITYHYEDGRLVNVTETGYIWQRRERRVDDIPGEVSPGIQRLIGALNLITATPCIAQADHRTRQHEREIEELARLIRELEKARADRADIEAVLNDPLTQALHQLRYMNDAQQDELFAEHPEVRDMAEAAEDVRDDLQDLMRGIDNSVRRFVDDYVIPTLTVASMVNPYARGAAMAYHGARAAIAVAPALARVAGACGAAEIYRRATAFFSENFSGGKDKGKADSSSRIRGTPQDANRYLAELRSQKGLLSDKKVSLDGREYYEFMKKFNHNGVRFRKGDYISRDALHHEWELFRGVKDHRGAISSVTRKLDTSKIDPSRRLKIK